MSAEDDDDDTQLSDFEAGFLMGHFEASGIDGEPTIEQFNAAAAALERVRKRMEQSIDALPDDEGH